MYYDDKFNDKLGKANDPVSKARKWWKARSGRDRFLIGCLGAVLVRAVPVLVTLPTQCIGNVSY